MKKYISISMLFAGFLFAACSDNSSSSSTDNGHEGEIAEIKPINIEKVYDITVNKETQVIKLKTIEEYACVDVEEKGKYEWKSVGTTTIDSIKYEFQGDTLVTYRMREEDYENDLEPEFEGPGRMYVGGKSGKLDGTWKSTGCYYGFNFNCDYDTEEGFDQYRNKYELKFSGNTLTYTRESHSLELDYIKTGFRKKFLESLEEGFFNLLITDIFWNTNEDLKKLKRIKLKEHTATGETFTMDDSITVSVNVKKYEEFVESFRGDRQLASIEISANGKTCTGIYEMVSVMSSEFCKDENARYFSKRLQYDANGDQYMGVRHYEKHNYTDFNICLYEILLNISEDDLDLRYID